MTHQAKVSQLARLVAARRTVAERELAKAANTVLKETAEAKRQGAARDQAKIDEATYIEKRFKDPEQRLTGAVFFESIALGGEQKRRQSTIARLKAERQEAVVEEAVKTRTAEGERYLAITRRQDGLGEIITRLQRAADQTEELREEDQLQELSYGKGAHGTA